MLPGQADCHTFAKRINTFTLVNVKQPELAKRLARTIPNARKDLIGRNVSSYDNREIPTYLRETRELLKLWQPAFANLGE